MPALKQASPCELRRALIPLSCRHILKSHPIMTMTGYIRSDGHSSDIPAVTSLTWVARKLQFLIRRSIAECVRVGKRSRWHSLLLPADPDGALGSLHTSILCRRQRRSVGLKSWISTWMGEREQLTGAHTQTLRYTTGVVSPFVHWQLLRLCCSWSPSGCCLFCISQ